MARLIDETWDLSKIDLSKWYCVRLNLTNTSQDHDKQIEDWLDRDENARGDWAYGIGAWDFLFSEENTALAFKLTFG